MSEELLPYYNRELSFLRRLGAEFADAHPKIAGRLRLGAEASEDPHVERLIQAVAYLNARVRHKLEDDFPEITNALLGVLYPHYQLPIPSMAIVQMELDPGQAELTTGYIVPPGTYIETEPIQGEPCRFRTGYPVTLWPIELRSASLTTPPFTAPVTEHSAQAVAMVRLVLRCRSEAVRFSALTLGSLRFFLKGQAQHVYRLYELLFNNVLEVAIANAPEDRNPVILDKGCLRPVGFELSEGLLPYPARSFLGYRLLTELFAFPEKYLFFDLGFDLPGQQGKALATIGSRLEVYVFLKATSPDLERNLTTDTLRLGCTPMINLYRQRAEPIQLTHAESEYRVVPDSRRPLAHEVYSIDRVSAVSQTGEQAEYGPMFSVKHAGDGRGQNRYWSSQRRAGGGLGAVGDRGTEVYLALVDLEFQASVPADWTVDLETTCLNRDLPHRLPFGGDQPRLQLSEGGAVVTRVSCLTAPTRTLRPALGRGLLWRLISHLSLNHLSIVEGDKGAEGLREILKLYDFTDSAETRAMIDGILGVTSRRIVARAGSAGADAVCRGVEVTLHFDDKKFTGSGLFLFASVLERFFALYCSVNSFSKLIVTTEGRKGELRRWPPRMGEKVLA
jgi:type VI secretion system protein ImpG